MTENTVKSFFKKYRLDVIVVSALLIFSLAALLVINLTKKDGAHVEITVDGEVVAKYSLSSDGVYSLNGGTNTLTVKGGVAYMSYSSCPDHTCERVGKVKYVGQTIVCLPNDLTITVIGESDNAVDFVS